MAASPIGEVAILNGLAKPGAIIDSKILNPRMIHLYVLLLENNNLYVGQSSQPKDRITAHHLRKGAAWTRLHRPKRVIKTWPTGETDSKRAEAQENKITLSMMQKFGWKRVRGGYWCNIDELETLKSLIHHQTSIEFLGFNLDKLLTESDIVRSGRTLQKSPLIT